MKSSVIEKKHRVTAVVDPEEHWDNLHQPQHNGLGTTLRHAGARLKSMHVAEIAGIAAAGFALGYLFFSRGGFTGRRHSYLRNVIGSSVIPAASKGFHRAYDTLRDGKSFERLGREVAKLRSHW